MSRSFRPLFVAAAVLALSAGCTPAHHPQVAVAPPPSGVPGVVVASRPVPPGASTARDAILARLGMPLPERAAPALVEVIVRTGDGQTLSVVQADRPTLRPGARVAMLVTPHARLVPAVTEVAAAPPP